MTAASTTPAAAAEPLAAGPVLVTGSQGYLGGWTVALLSGTGIAVREFDVVLGDDLMDVARLGVAVAGCSAVVHLAAVPHDDAGSPEEIMRTNVLGTWHVLQAARRAGVPRVVMTSSGMATGYFQYGMTPDHLPLDDSHEARPRSPYSLSKRLAEQMCETVSADGGPVTVALRPTMIVAPEHRDGAARDFAAAVAAGARTVDYGAWVDPRDVAGAIELALSAPTGGSLTCLVSADDLIGGEDSGTLARRAYPGLAHRAGPGPLVRSDRARAVLGWRPRWAWDGPVESPRETSVGSPEGAAAESAPEEGALPW